MECEAEGQDRRQVSCGSLLMSVRTAELQRQLGLLLKGSAVSLIPVHTLCAQCQGRLAQASTVIGRLHSSMHMAHFSVSSKMVVSTPFAAAALPLFLPPVQSQDVGSAMLSNFKMEVRRRML